MTDTTPPPQEQLPDEPGEEESEGSSGEHLTPADALLILLVGASGAIFLLWLSKAAGVTGAALELPSDFQSGISNLWAALTTAGSGLLVWLLAGRPRTGGKYLHWIVGLAVSLPIVAIGINKFAAPACPPSTDAPFTGHWDGRISWKRAWADTLLNYDGSDSTFRAADPRSVGNLYIYRSPAGVYRGYSYWETKNGDATYSRLAVFPDEFEFDSAGKLLSFEMNTAMREKLRDFPYGPFQHYRLIFKSASAKDFRLRGWMLVVREDREDTVGTVLLSR
jgi:hypothetical protein